jgi:hypothetical protein
MQQRHNIEDPKLSFRFHLSKIKEIADDAQRLIERYDEIKALSYTVEHQYLFDQIKSFIDSHTA